MKGNSSRPQPPRQSVAKHPVAKQQPPAGSPAGKQSASKRQQQPAQRPPQQHSPARSGRPQSPAQQQSPAQPARQQPPAQPTKQQPPPVQPAKQPQQSAAKQPPPPTRVHSSRASATQPPIVHGTQKEPPPAPFRGPKSPPTSAVVLQGRRKEPAPPPPPPRAESVRSGSPVRSQLGQQHPVGAQGGYVPPREPPPPLPMPPSPVSPPRQSSARREAAPAAPPPAASPSPTVQPPRLSSSGRGGGYSSGRQPAGSPHTPPRPSGSRLSAVQATSPPSGSAAQPASLATAGSPQALAGGLMRQQRVRTTRDVRVRGEPLVPQGASGIVEGPADNDDDRVAVVFDTESPVRFNVRPDSLEPLDAPSAVPAPRSVASQLSPIRLDVLSPGSGSPLEAADKALERRRLLAAVQPGPVSEWICPPLSLQSLPATARAALQDEGPGASRLISPKPPTAGGAGVGAPGLTAVESLQSLSPHRYRVFQQMSKAFLEKSLQAEDYRAGLCALFGESAVDATAASLRASSTGRRD